ncbi:MAG: methyltransferase domain-containing protein [Gammaproteobacteria bacterium]|nr:methyltransferase domain-containing protein [Gammaproteobacteria bacterium]
MNSPPPAIQQLTAPSSSQNSARIKWNKRYLCNTDSSPAFEPALVLLEYAHLLPGSGRALEVACGLGGNTLFLARRMFEVDAWDISDVAIGRLIQRAGQEKLAITAETRDVLRHPPAPKCYDVIVVSRFLERAMIPNLIQALRPKGLIFYQTFIKDKDPCVGPKNPAYLLGENELLTLFSRLKVVLYREEGQLGDCHQGLRNEAMLVAQNW